MKKFLILMLMILMVLPVGVSAEEYNTAPVEQITEKNEQQPTTTPPQNNSNDPALNYADSTIVQPGVTLEDAGNKVTSKLYEVANWLKIIAKPIAMIMFVIGAIMMVFGALSKRDGIKTGVIVIVCAVIMYAITMYADPIIQWFVAWIAS